MHRSVFEALKRESHVVTIPGAAFGPAGEGHLRFSFACSPEEIVEGFRRLRSWAETLGDVNNQSDRLHY